MKALSEQVKSLQERKQRYHTSYHVLWVIHHLSCNNVLVAEYLYTVHLHMQHEEGAEVHLHGQILDQVHV